MKPDAPIAYIDDHRTRRLILPVPLILISLFCVYQGMVNAMCAMKDKPVYYTLSIPFIKYILRAAEMD
jgi:hypothetical protein